MKRRLCDLTDDLFEPAKVLVHHEPEELELRFKMKVAGLIKSKGLDRGAVAAEAGISENMLDRYVSPSQVNHHLNFLVLIKLGRILGREFWDILLKFEGHHVVDDDTVELAELGDIAETKQELAEREKRIRNNRAKRRRVTK